MPKPRPRHANKLARRFEARGAFHQSRPCSGHAAVMQWPRAEAVMPQPCRGHAMEMAGDGVVPDELRRMKTRRAHDHKPRRCAGDEDVRLIRQAHACCGLRTRTSSTTLTRLNMEPHAEPKTAHTVRHV